jgi:hypothetical protein
VARTRVPGLVDVLRVDDPHEIAVLAVDDRLDRRFARKSALLNALIIWRLRRVLADQGHPLPSVAPRHDAARIAGQAALRQRLAPLAKALRDGGPELEPLAAFVRGEGAPDQAGILVQSAVGGLFAPSYAASATTYDAAKVFDTAARSFNPFLLAWWALTGKVTQARCVLSDAVGGDLAGIHATGIALHNIVNGVVAMRSLFADAPERARLSTEAAVARCLFAPPQILRQPLREGTSPAGDFGTGTLVVLGLGAAETARGPDRNVIFMENSWSRCPADDWVPALFEGAWRRATRPKGGAVS